MEIERLLPQQPWPCTSQYAHAGQPYYIVAPAYDHRSGGIRVLHQLCSLLNQLGQQAYMVSSGLNGQLWTPELSDAVKLAHYRSGKKPIVVYPEVTRGTPLQIGQSVRYVLNFPGFIGGESRYAEHELIYTYDGAYYPQAPVLRLPLFDLGLILNDCLPPEQRSGVAYFHNRYTASGGKLRDFGPQAVEISAGKPATHAETLQILKSVRLLYTYEHSALVFEALLSGCAVVFLPNPKRHPNTGQIMDLHRLSGIAWEDESAAVERALASVQQARDEILQLFRNWLEQLQQFVQQTQQAAERLPLERAWPQAEVDQLPGVCTTQAEAAARADRLFWRNVHEQYQQWSERRTLREIDADIYAERLNAGQVQPLTLLIDQRGASPDQLADTLDSLGQCLGMPAALHIVADTPPPAALADAACVHWHTMADGAVQDAIVPGTDWLLLLASGTRLEPRALMEWGLAPAQFPQAQLIYADDDHYSADAQQRYPHFKPDANVELLRCSNYLGPAVALRRSAWLHLGRPLCAASLYRAALQLLHETGRNALGHIDTVLAHAGRGIDSNTEAREFDAVQALLRQHQVAERVQPLPRWGTWLPEHRLQGQSSVALVVPTGLQTGYLRSLLLACARYNDLALSEVVLVCQEQQRAEVELASADTLALPIRIITLPDGEYQHAAALNAGVAAVRSEFVLVCDDDTEPLHAGWLQRLVAIAQQPDVALVAPRLMLQQTEGPLVVGGPVVLGIQGVAAGYRGMQGLPDEVGAHSRLQLTQDVSAVAGHCFVLRSALWQQVSGLRGEAYPMFFPVLDLCLRLGALGLRHVWTPLAGVMHHGGKTLASRRREPLQQIRLADQELAERQQLLQDWADALASDPCYNRQLSLWRPFEIDAEVVVDWNPQRRDRPRLLALPITSGSGQYRVVEPMHALQNAALAQTCVVLPKAKGMQRVLQPLELRRAAPDVLVLQHSVDDGLLAQVRNFKLAAPATLIVQMVDDLLGEVPEKHPNRVYQSREGHRRMVDALRASERLVVTTEPLRNHYRKYLPDVRVVPNSLDTQWFGLDVKRNPPGQRLRVGWVGAGQHQGDLALIEPIVAEFAAEVDWVFMGMSTDAIRPLLKEFHGFVPIGEYPAKMATLALDIAIAPLEDNLFNRCKSNLRLLEYGAMGWPVVCSDVYPYRSNEAPVLRCATLDEWRAALRRLIDQPHERERLGQALHQWVLSHYRLQGLLPQWHAALFAAADKAMTEAAA